jgi:threonine/homoserine/homoserine lactone efflux protein
MPSLSTYVWFSLTAMLIVVIPGPSVLFIVGRSLALGRRAGLVSVLGNNLGLSALALAVAFGIGTLIAASHVTLIMLKIVGAAYLVYLGVQTIRHRRRVGPSAIAKSGHRIFVQSFLVGFTNPKILVLYVAMLPQFVQPGSGPAALQLAIFGLTFNALCLANDSIWAVGAGSAREWFARRPYRNERLATIGGVMMIGVGAALAVDSPE